MDKLKILVHSFNMSDNDDPEIFAGQPIWEWQQTDAGRWVMAHSRDTYWLKHNDFQSYTYQYKIVAQLTEQDATYFALKYDNTRTS